MRAVGLLVVAAAMVASTVAGQQATGVATRVTGGVFTYVVAAGDTLQSIGSRFGVDPATLTADNGLTTAKLTPNQTLRIDNRHIVPEGASQMLTINVPQRMLFYPWEGTVVGMPVSVGTAGWKTPIQPFRILTKETDPTWDVPESIRREALAKGRVLPRAVPPGPDNPLGKYWLGLSIPSVGIHGTNAPTSIYRVTTHGCIRMGAGDIAWLFTRVEINTPGQFIYEPILLTVTQDDVLLEVHRDVYSRLKMAPVAVVHGLAERAGVLDQIAWGRVEQVLAARHGVARSIQRAQ